MAFGDNTRPSTDNSGATKSTGESIYIKLGEESVVRILDRSEKVLYYWRYYMQVNVGGKPADRSIVVGLDGPVRNCPIRAFMNGIGDADRRFRKPGKRMLLNVLDRSDNKVKILDFGPDLLGKFTALHNRVRNNKTFEPMALWDFDLQIVSIPGKEAKDVQRSVLPGMDQEPLSSDLGALLKYDLSLVSRIMPDEMQVRLLAGEDLLEILKELNWGRPEPTVKQ